MNVNFLSIQSVYKELNTQWSGKSRDIKKCGELLDDLKLALTKMAFLPTESGHSKEELIICRDILEFAVEYSVTSRDIPAFQRYMSQLKCYYYDYKNQIGESANMYKLLGLNLLYLLSVNRVSEFHTELELLPADVLLTNKFIRPILALEQYIMEGRYNKIFQAGNSIPLDSYKYFMNILFDTVRDEIGACIEKSYEKISAKEAGKRLSLKSLEEVKAFGLKRNWKLNGDGSFSFVDKTASRPEELPAIELAEQAIFYARELEMIV